MPAARRFVTLPSTDARDFGRDALIETWRFLLPQDALVLGARGLRGRLGLLGKETLTLSAAATESAQSADMVAAGSLAALWNRGHDLTLTPGPSALAVSTGADSVIRADDLAAAATAVAGELELASIVVVELADRDADATKQLARAFRRVTDIPVSVVTHTDSVAATVAVFASCNVFVTHDEPAAAIARSVHTPTVRLGAHDDLTELYLAIRTTTADADAVAADVAVARATAFALDAWARGRMSADDLRAAVADPSRIDELVGA